MSEAPVDIDDVDALLNEVLRADMLLLRHVNAQALAATEPDALNGLVRSQQRLARSVRTTITTRARLGRERDEAGRRAAHEECVKDPYGQVRNGYQPGNALQDAVEAQVRLEYDPAEVEAIEFELPHMLFEAWDEHGYGRMLPADRLARAMAYLRETFGPSKTRRPPPPVPGRPAPKGPVKPALPEPERPEPEPPPAAAHSTPEPTPEPPPAPEPPPLPPPPPEPAPDPPYIPPWEFLKPGQRFPGGSGW